MDCTRFDKLARALFSATSRREAVTTLATATLGLGAIRFGASDALAGKNNNKNKNKHKNKKKNRNKNKNTKDLREQCTKNSECKGDLLCQAANSQQSCPGQEFGTFCCVETDVQAPCNDSCDCCGIDVICNGGFCQSA